MNQIELMQRLICESVTLYVGCYVTFEVQFNVLLLLMSSYVVVYMISAN